MLKPGGTFLIRNEGNGETETDEKWMDTIDDMTIYKGTELKTYLDQTVFHDIQIHKTKSWLCVTGNKQKI